MKRTALSIVAAAIAIVWASSAGAGEIGYVEEFSLAKDREAVLKQLIPGTDQYYYYHCLHFQNTGQDEKLADMLSQWIKRRKPRASTSLVREIKNRQALLNYRKDPQATLKYLKEDLGLHFHHQREVLGRKTSLPTSLDPRLISPDTLTREALRRHPGTVNGFENSALQWLIARDIGADRRRHLLRRLTRPDLPKLPELIVADLRHKHSRGFGSMTIHRALLLRQLDQCLRLKGDLLNETNFVNIYLSKLRPNPDEDWRNDPKVRDAYLKRLWAFVSRLAPVHNSLKAHVLHQRLVFDRSRGVYDKKLFMEYIKLPRRVVYINPKYMERLDSRRYPANLNANYTPRTMLPVIRRDEPVVRSYLLHFFVDENSYKPYELYIRDTYLKELFAETKIVNGLGDMEQWYSMLPPEKVKRLRERVDIDFAHTNRKLFTADERVGLDLYVKNVKTLIVNVYQINAFNYYRDKLREVNTDINLDGLVANEEKVYEYKDVPLRRVKRHFDFASLDKRGVYVIDFIGNGKSSRALIRKGKLRFIERTSTAGHVFTVMDETNRKLPKAAIWLSGHKYVADEDGEITVPFSNSPSRQPIILTDGDFASLDRFDHQAERYTLQAGIHTDREALLAGKTAQVIVRAALFLNNTPVTLSVLTDVSLVITSIDSDGVGTTKEVKNFKLFEGRESVHEFRTPQRLSRISFTLKAKVRNLSKDKKQDLAASASFSLNGIDRTVKVEDLHLARVGGRYVLEVLGKTGEAKADRPIRIELKHRDFRNTVHVPLQTDKGGRVMLGELKDIAWVRATGPAGTQHTWHMVRDMHSYPSNIHSQAGETIYLPYMGSRKDATPEELSLLEVRGSTFVADRFNALRIKDGFIEIRSLPRGDYDLLIKPINTRISIRLADGKERQRYVLGANRHLGVHNAKPLQIAGVDAVKDTVRIRLKNATKFTRVHVAATRYLPEYSMYGDLGVAFREPGAAGLAKALCAYVAGRNIGDEYRYIIDRKYARKFPGVMLRRPSLLLNPWAIRKTDAGRQVARAGEQYGRRRMPGAPSRGRYIAGKKKVAPGVGFANLDFLRKDPATVLANLTPDKNGVITIKRKDLGAHQHIHVLAVDPQNTAYRELSLPEVKAEFDDLRLQLGLDPDKHFTEQKRISIVRKGETFTLDDVINSKSENYDSFAKVYAFYVTLTGDKTLVEFGFLLRWPEMKDEEKRKLYSKYACHELNFFISRKDPAFFEKVVLPYLRNKKDKTFLDHWLCGDDLKAYLKPWSHEQLNIVERILLARRIEDERVHTTRHVKDLFDLIPPDIERFNRLFAIALKAGALDTGDVFLETLGRVRSRAEIEALAANGGMVRDSVRRLRAPGGARFDKPASAPTPARARREAEIAKGKRMADGAEMEDAYFGVDGRKRDQARQFYRKLDKTKEWVENNYYHLPIKQQNASLVKVNAFWNDYARSDGKGEFLSTNLAEASANFTEMMFAMSVLDLPFEPAKHKTKDVEKGVAVEAGSPMVVFHKQIRPAERAAKEIPILVSQNFFRHSDRYRYVNNERLDKFVTDEFLVHVVYGCQVVVTNPTSSRQKLEVLVQIPQGAMPVLNCKETRGMRIDLDPYRTQSLEYYFYFPAAGKWKQYPVHVARDGKMIAAAGPFVFNVVEKLSRIDKTSWDYVSQNGTDEQVIEYLKHHNLNRTKLDRIAFRMKDKALFRRVVEMLTSRHVYDHTLWSYGIRHDLPAAIREYLRHCDRFVSQCGEYLDSELLKIDPVVRKTYEHMEYWPLVNARAHRLGKVRRIVNERMFAQYNRLLKVLSYRREMDDADLMSVTYYMLLQDRIEEALKFFGRVKAEKLATRLQYDYFTAYTDFYSDSPKRARKIALKYRDYPVDRWRKRFVEVLAQLDEIEGKAGKVAVAKDDEDDRTRKQTALAATEPNFEFKVENRKVRLNYQSLKSCRVNYYRMDIELLFSRNPFVESRRAGGQFSYIRPNASATVALDPKKKTLVFDLPKEFHDANVLVEIVAAGRKKSQAYYSNSLAIQVIENYGHVKVAHASTHKPLAKVYVKVYAKMTDGRVRFFKDGYTDLRGRFDYTSLNTDELTRVAKFSLLVLSEENGAVVREANPPKR